MCIGILQKMIQPEIYHTAITNCVSRFDKFLETNTLAFKNKIYRVKHSEVTISRNSGCQWNAISN